MNIISVYRKVAFITSSRLTSRRSELTHIHAVARLYPGHLDWFQGSCLCICHLFLKPIPVCGCSLSPSIFPQTHCMSELLCLTFFFFFAIVLHVGLHLSLLSTIKTHTRVIAHHMDFYFVICNHLTCTSSFVHYELNNGSCKHKLQLTEFICSVSHFTKSAED